jgi:hypothetical protein
VFGFEGNQTEQAEKQRGLVLSLGLGVDLGLGLGLGLDLGLSLVDQCLGLGLDLGLGLLVMYFVGYGSWPPSGLGSWSLF